MRVRQRTVTVCRCLRTDVWRPARHGRKEVQPHPPSEQLAPRRRSQRPSVLPRSAARATHQKLFDDDRSSDIRFSRCYVTRCLSNEVVGVGGHQRREQIPLWTMSPPPCAGSDKAQHAAPYKDSGFGGARQPDRNYLVRQRGGAVSFDGPWTSKIVAGELRRCVKDSAQIALVTIGFRAPPTETGYPLWGAACWPLSDPHHTSRGDLIFYVPLRHLAEEHRELARKFCAELSIEQFGCRAHPADGAAIERQC